MANWLYEPDDLLDRWGLGDVRLVLSRHAPDMEALTRLRRRERAGELVRLADGVRVPASVLVALPFERRDLLRILAVALTWTVGGVVSHHSAAAIHGLPSTTRAAPVHAIVPPASGGRSSGHVRRHAIILHADEVATVHGLRVTSLVRTVADWLPRSRARLRSRSRTLR